jgi:hypothetical protein
MKKPKLTGPYRVKKAPKRKLTTVERKAAAKRGFARTTKKAGGIVKLIDDNTLCKRRRVASGVYKRSNKCSADEKVRTTLKYSSDGKARGTYTPSGGDSILNPKRGKSNKPRRRTVKR